MNAFQVYYNEKLVGALKNVSFDIKNPPVEIALMNSYSKTELSHIYDIVWVNTEKRNKIVGEYEFNMMMALKSPGKDVALESNHILAHCFGVPGYAQKIPTLESHEFQFSWYVAAPNLKQYEFMFDLHNFVPL